MDRDASPFDGASAPAAAQRRRQARSCSSSHVGVVVEPDLNLGLRIQHGSKDVRRIGGDRSRMASRELPALSLQTLRLRSRRSASPSRSPPWSGTFGLPERMTMLPVVSSFMAFVHAHVIRAFGCPDGAAAQADALDPGRCRRRLFLRSCSRNLPWCHNPEQAGQTRSGPMLL